MYSQHRNSKNKQTQQSRRPPTSRQRNPQPVPERSTSGFNKRPCILKCDFRVFTISYRGINDYATQLYNIRDYHGLENLFNALVTMRNAIFRKPNTTVSFTRAEYGDIISRIAADPRSDDVFPFTETITFGDDDSLDTRVYGLMFHAMLPSIDALSRNQSFEFINVLIKIRTEMDIAINLPLKKDIIEERDELVHSRPRMSREDEYHINSRLHQQVIDVKHRIWRLSDVWKAYADRRVKGSINLYTALSQSRISPPEIHMWHLFTVDDFVSIRKSGCLKQFITLGLSSDIAHASTISDIGIQLQSDSFYEGKDIKRIMETQFYVTRMSQVAEARLYLLYQEYLDALTVGHVELMRVKFIGIINANRDIHMSLASLPGGYDYVEFMQRFGDEYIKVVPDVPIGYIELAKKIDETSKSQLIMHFNKLGLSMPIVDREFNIALSRITANNNDIRFLECVFSVNALYAASLLRKYLSADTAQVQVHRFILDALAKSTCYPEVVNVVNDLSMYSAAAWFDRLYVLHLNHTSTEQVTELLYGAIESSADFRQPICEAIRLSVTFPLKLTNMFTGYPEGFIERIDPANKYLPSKCKDEIVRYFGE